MLCLLSPEAVVPAAHPVRRIKALADEALAALSADKAYDTRDFVEQCR